MHTPIRKISSALLPGLIAGLLAGCSGEAPSGPSPVAERGGGDYQQLGVAGLSADEQFNCSNVGQVHVRFSEPGWVQDNVVGLYVSFTEVPETAVRLKVSWDHDKAPEQFELVPLAPSDFTRSGERVNFSKLIEHTYRDVTQRSKRRVRVELEIVDQTGNCARVREVSLSPPPVAEVFCSVTTGGHLYGKAASTPGVYVFAKGKFLFPFAPGTSLPNGARPSSILENPVAGSQAAEWSYSKARGAQMSHGKHSFFVTGGDCGVPLKRVVD